MGINICLQSLKNNYIDFSLRTTFQKLKRLLHIVVTSILHRDLPCAGHTSFNILHCPWYNRHNLHPILGNNHIILDSNTSKTRALAAIRMTFQITSNIMNIHSHKMSQTMGLENTTSQVDSHHLVNITFKYTSFQERQQNLPVSQQVHVWPGYSRLCRCQNGLCSPPNCIVDHLLLVSELARYRVGASNVRTKAEIFGTHIKEHRVSSLNTLIIGSTSMTIMKHCSTTSRSTNTSIANMAAASVGVSIIHKFCFCLVLPGNLASLDLTHNMHMGS